MPTWTKDAIRHLLATNDRAVCKAMIVLYDRQTITERQTDSTNEDNSRGFSAFHAKTGSYYGRWCKSGRALTGHHLAKARKMALRYAQQLADQANLNQAKKEGVAA